MTYNRYMKKLIFLSLLFFVFTSVHAQSLTVTGCLELNASIRQGMKDTSTSSNVYALQSFLKVRNYMTANPTGYFGTQTLKAVKAFQKANNISATGLVGPMTRTAIQKISCVSAIPDPVSPAIPQLPTPVPPVPVVETPVVPTPPVVEDVILTAPNNSSLKVKTDGTISIYATSLLVRGSITGGARSGTEQWFELTTNPIVYKLSETKTTAKAPQRTDDIFEEVIDGLTSNTTYYYRACAENVSLGQKSCGGTVSVKTN